VLEADRVFANVPFTIKIFYNDTFYLTELTEEEVADFNSQACDHDHDMGSQDDE
jgi:hypothetical protein